MSFYRLGVRKEPEQRSRAEAFSSVIVKSTNWKTVFEDKKHEKINKKFNFFLIFQFFSNT